MMHIIVAELVGIITQKPSKQHRFDRYTPPLHCPQLAHLNYTDTRERKGSRERKGRGGG